MPNQKATKKPPLMSKAEQERLRRQKCPIPPATADMIYVRNGCHQPLGLYKADLARARLAMQGWDKTVHHSGNRGGTPGRNLVNSDPGLHCPEHGGLCWWDGHAYLKCAVLSCTFDYTMSHEEMAEAGLT